MPCRYLLPRYCQSLSQLARELRFAGCQIKCFYFGADIIICWTLNNGFYFQSVMKECISETQKSNITLKKLPLIVTTRDTAVLNLLSDPSDYLWYEQVHFSLFTSLNGLFKHWSGVTKKAFLIYIKCLYVDMGAYASGPCLCSVVIFLVEFKLITYITIYFFRLKKKKRNKTRVYHPCKS